MTDEYTNATNFQNVKPNSMCIIHCYVYYNTNNEVNNYHRGFNVHMQEEEKSCTTY